MSLFGSLMGDFDDDAAMFGNQMRSMNMQMRQMSRMMNSLMPDPFNMLTPFDAGFGAQVVPMHQHQHQYQHQHQRHPGLFGFPSMPNMNRLLSGDMGDNCNASFSSSSVFSMSSGPDGRPQIYQATSSTKTGPGGVRETRKTVQDSSSGLKKMAIGHHIGERAHIIEKEQNTRSGDLEERQEFINLDEEEAEDFDREFTNKVRRSGPTVEVIGDSSGIYNQPRHNQYQRQILPALPAPPPSVHPHPYNASAARRNFRSKHSKNPNQINPNTENQ